MNESCKQVEEALDRSANGMLPEDLAAHAARCDVCRERVAIERAIQDGLSEVAGPDGSARRALAERILAAGPVAAEGAEPARARVLRWPWAAAAAAAAVAAVLIGMFAFKPEPREPIRPTAIFADLLGPLPEIAGPSEQTNVPETNEASPLSSAVELLSGDLEGPIALGRAIFEAPLSAASADTPDRKRPDVDTQGRERSRAK